MEKLLVHPTYFGPISQYIAMFKAKEIIFENEDNYQKQTYRNRMYIYGANGKLLLNIPIKHTGNKSNHQKYKDVRVENSFPWQSQHWKSLETVYRTSPFFEFYEDEFQPLYQKKFEFLMDFNYQCLELALDCLQTEITSGKTTEFILHPQNITNGRPLVDAKRTQMKISPYPQVFQEKFGFINDLSIIDLIFNEGPNALNYLENEELVLPQI
ncbi:WbqC family protein [Salinimicrobium oceani]|uniref:WbqC family protein n=1 Tax=Salinimicrobium oceani TaxID=2722702 RepID=A0ABX1CY80_9FLAO|nr:WbqC family protein [Salinimicrobium oceani]NJW51601.1 WbqC family protein [Salinimicrobium oceani]